MRGRVPNLQGSCSRPPFGILHPAAVLTFADRNTVWVFFFPSDRSHHEQRNKSAPTVAFYGNVLLSVTNTAGWQISHVSYDFNGGGGVAQPLWWLHAWFKYNHKFINLRTIRRRRFHRNTANARGRLRCASHPSLCAFSAFTYPQDSFCCTPETRKDSQRPPYLKKKKKGGNKWIMTRWS